MQSNTLFFYKIATCFGPIGSLSSLQNVQKDSSCISTVIVLRTEIISSQFFLNNIHCSKIQLIAAETVQQNSTFICAYQLRKLCTL